MSTPTHAALDPTAISCPNKQTTVLTGTDAPPSESLIAYLSARPVGGGSSRQDGTWRIPLQVNERPGIYNVEVKVRGTGILVERFTCYVDVSLTDSPETPTQSGAATPPSGAVTAAPGRTAPASPTTSVTNRTVTPTVTSIRTASTGATATRAATTTAAATTAATTTAATATATETATTTTTTIATATITPTTDPAASGMKINDVVCRDPKFPDDSEFIELRNDSSVKITLTGWRVINASRSNVSYTFPSFTINAGPDVYVAVYSGIGTNRPDPGSGEFYWGRTDQLWLIGEKAELRDGAGKLIDSYTVLASSC